MALDLTGEPVTLAEAKGHLGVRNDFRDGEISRLIVAARERVEGYSGRALKRREVTETFDGFRSATGAPIALKLGPVHSVDSIAYMSGDGLVLHPPGGVVMEFDNSFRLLSRGDGWPVVPSGTPVQVRYTAGFGGEGAAVPQMLVQAMLLLVGLWFENHEGAVVGRSAVELPEGVKSLCRDFRPAGVS